MKRARKKENKEEKTQELEEGTEEKLPDITKETEETKEGVTEEVNAEITGEQEEKAKEEAPEAEEKEAEAPEEAKEEKGRKKEEEEEFVEERIYTVPLGKAWIMPPRRRAPRAMRMLKAFIVKHMKLEAQPTEEEEEEPKQLIVDNEVNEKIWGRGIEKPPRKIRVRAAKDKEGNVTVFLAEGE